jgi:hypothetical protein
MDQVSNQKFCMCPQICVRPPFFSEQIRIDVTTTKPQQPYRGWPKAIFWGSRVIFWASPQLVFSLACSSTIDAAITLDFILLFSSSFHPIAPSTTMGIKNASTTLHSITDITLADVGHKCQRLAEMKGISP